MKTSKTNLAFDNLIDIQLEKEVMNNLKGGDIYDDLGRSTGVSGATNSGELVVVNMGDYYQIQLDGDDILPHELASDDRIIH